jgi:hypothetical protein
LAKQRGGGLLLPLVLLLPTADSITSSNVR